MSWHVDFTNGDLFRFETEAEARAFYRGFQYAKRLAIEAAFAAAEQPPTATNPTLPSRAPAEIPRRCRERQADYSPIR